MLSERKRAGITSGDEDLEDDANKGDSGIHDAITNRLKREELEESGKFQQSIASNFSKEYVPDLVDIR